MNIGHVITYNILFSICSQYVEFHEVFPQKVMTNWMVLLCHKLHAKSPDKYQNYSLILPIVDCSSLWYKSFALQTVLNKWEQFAKWADFPWIRASSFSVGSFFSLICILIAKSEAKGTTRNLVQPLGIYKILVLEVLIELYISFSSGFFFTDWYNVINIIKKGNKAHYE